MSLLQYTSSEMFSSTELIRKSKKIFDKLNQKDIEKAVILRDGKPSFMLMDFNKYEELINEYIKLKENQTSAKEHKKTVQKEKKEIIEEKNTYDQSLKSDEEINKEDLKNALAQIEELDLSSSKTKTDSTNSEVHEPQLKDFWE